MTRTPVAELIYEAIMDIADAVSLGQGPLGERRLIAIEGGEFAGPRLRGRVLPGGADRQLVRPDGVRLLEEQYEMQCEDGAVLTVLSRSKIVEKPGTGRQAFSQLEITAPAGPHGWLNDAVLVGTLESLRPARRSVRVRVFQLA